MERNGAVGLSDPAYLASSEFTLDPSAAELPGWTGRTERQFNQWYAQERYSGAGEIVDLGCMSGSSTLPLAVGLRNNSRVERRESRIHAYDLFIKTWPRRDGEPLEQVPYGANFRPIFEQNVAPYLPYIVVHEVNLTNVEWSAGPIEYLLIDAMKSWDLTTSITLKFFPNLISGRSVVVHQDFLHYYGSWIHILMYRLRSQLRPVFAIPNSESVVFECQAAITVEDCKRACHWDFITRAELDAAFDYSSEIVPPKYRVHVQAAKAMFFWHLGTPTADAEVFPLLGGTPSTIASHFDDPLRLAVEEFFKIPPRYERLHGIRETKGHLAPHIRRYGARHALTRLRRWLSLRWGDLVKRLRGLERRARGRFRLRRERP